VIPKPKSETVPAADPVESPSTSSPAERQVDVTQRPVPDIPTDADVYHDLYQELDSHGNTY